MKSRNLRLTMLVAVLAATLGIATAQSVDDLNNPPPGEWPQYGRDAAQTRYSPLDQINTSNVGQVQLAWARALGYTQNFQGSPSVWNGIMYVSNQTGVLALDATNGNVIWQFSSPRDAELIPIADSAPRGSPVVFEGKVFINLRYGETVALDALTGEEVWRSLTTQPALMEGQSTHPIFADGKIVLGPTGADSGGSPGRILALDIEDGELLWSFDVVPMTPDDPAFSSWTNPPSWEDGIGGGSAWNAGAYDHVTRTVVYGTGQPTPWDRVDSRRRDDGEPTADLYTSSFVGLDVDTGALKWYHQVVPGDEWDYDQHIVPMFGDIDGRRVALLPTTTGFMLVLDADTGEMLASNLAANETTVHLGYDDDGTPIINPDARFTDEGQFHRMCPGLRWAHIAPGAFSPDTGLIYRPNQIGCINFGPMMLPDLWQPGERAWFWDDGGRDDSMWFDRLGALSAIDPMTGETVWEYAHDYGHDIGPVVTGGGLVFSVFMDRHIRALDASSGEVLWQQPVTSGSRGGSITYEVDGKQYVAAMVGVSSVGTGAIPDFNPNVDLPPIVTGQVSLFVYALP